MDLYIARQPVFDQNLKLYGYELLCREDDKETIATIKDDNQATAQVIFMGVIEIGLEKLVGANKAFVNLSYDYLLSKPELQYPSQNVILEIPAHIKVDDELIAACKQLYENGHTIALDHVSPDIDTLQLLPFSHIVKIDILKTPPDQLQPLITQLKQYPVKLLALKVEDGSQLNKLIDMGFEYLQGNFFSNPIDVMHKHLSTNQLAILELLSKVYNEDIEAEELVELISRDVSLSYHLLRYINSAFFHLPEKVESMHQAIVYLGRNEIKSWATIISMAGNSEKPDELIKLAMIRGKMCELLAVNSKLPKREAYFTVGLLSSLDALMDQPMSLILPQLPLNNDIQQSLLERSGPMGEALNCNLAFEQCQWNKVQFGDFSISDLNELYLEAINWADDALKNM